MIPERRLVLDCDPGCDDALAILLAIQSGVYKAIDIATVAGNVGVNQTTANATRICALGSEYGLLDNKKIAVKVYRGGSAPLDGRRPSAASVHGRDGLGDVPLAALLKDSTPEEFCANQISFFADEPASQLYRRILDTPPDLELSRDLICTGPLTNLAIFLLSLSESEERSFWSRKRWRRFVVMGGAVRVPGNVSYAAEFNIYADPDAMTVVLASLTRTQRDCCADEKPPPLVMVPLDATEDTYLRWQWNFEECNPFAQAIGCLLRKYFLFHSMTYPPPFDPRMAPDEAAHHVEDRGKRRANQKQIAMQYRQERLAGSSGLKKLPMWCFLHDPLAVWVAIQRLDEDAIDLFEDIPFRMDTSSGEGRGHLYDATHRESFLELVARSRSHSASIEEVAEARHHLLPRSDLSEVKALLPKEEKRRVELRENLEGALCALLGLKA